MATNNSVDVGLSGQTGTGNFVGNLTPSITTPKITTSILDANGNTIILFFPVASAVNYIGIENQATGISPFIRGLGSDANISVSMITQGTGGFIIQGFTDGSSGSAGNVGEVISSGATAVALSNGVQKNITSISVTAGSWIISGYVGFNPTTATATAYLCGISTTTGTLPTTPSSAPTSINIVEGISTTQSWYLPLNPIPVNVASTTPYYLVADAAYTGTSMAGSGFIMAQRIR